VDILIVEDDERLARYVERTLLLAGHRTDTAVDGLIGLEKAAANPYDLILLDVLLPSLDGVSVCRELRQRRIRVLIRQPGQSNPALVFEIREEIGRMERLTRDLLTLARSDRGELRLALGRVDLLALARDLGRRVSRLAEERGIRLEVTSPNTPVVIEADPERLQQVGLIILDNALNHTPRGGVITVAVYASDGAGILAVEDTGEGIPEEHLSRVFDRFHRIDPSRTRATGGAGLGLAIARSLVSAHGGDISIASGSGGGTRVTVRLPLLATDALTDDLSPAHAEAGHHIRQSSGGTSVT
jgi:signal transduction histidine kinase